MYEETRKLPIAQQGVGDYWKLMDGTKLRGDMASLSCPDYCSFLLLNMAYTKSKQAHERARPISVPTRLRTCSSSWQRSTTERAATQFVFHYHQLHTGRQGHRTYRTPHQAV